MQEFVEHILGTDQQVTDFVLRSLRHFNNQLRDLMPNDMRQEMHRILESSLVGTQDTEILRKTQYATEDRLLGEKTASLARIKLMTVLALERSSLYSEITIDPDRLGSFAPIVDFDIATMTDDNNGSTRQVLVEWMRYDSPIVDEQKGYERLIRVEAIAELLNSADKPDDFRVLHCDGFFHDSKDLRYGLVYDFPGSTKVEGIELRAVTLGHILDDDESRSKSLPALEDRFRLAHLLASSVSEFHKVGWLHKAISSFHVVFFPPKNGSITSHIVEPYIVGFNHSRPDDPCAFTEGLFEGSYIKEYQHPEYLQNRLRYRLAFDYYSIGIVLLEIGLWTSLAKLTVNGREGKIYRRLTSENAEGFLERLRRKSVSLLKQAMGTRYFNVVERCLTGTFEDHRKAEDAASTATTLHLKYERLVVEELASCSL